MVCFSENVIKEDFFKGGEDALEISEMVFVMCTFVNIKFDGFGGKSRIYALQICDYKSKGLVGGQIISSSIIFDQFPSCMQLLKNKLS